MIAIPSIISKFPILRKLWPFSPGHIICRAFRDFAPRSRNTKTKEQPSSTSGNTRAPTLAPRFPSRHIQQIRNGHDDDEDEDADVRKWLQMVGVSRYFVDDYCWGKRFVCRSQWIMVLEQGTNSLGYGTPDGLGGCEH